MSVLPFPAATQPDNLREVAAPGGPGREVVLVTEGTYPHAHGGVSVWCDQLVQGLSEQPFRVVALTAFGYQRPVWDLPGNVGDLLTVGLWDHVPRARRRGRASPLAAALAALLASPTEEVAWFGGLVDMLSGLDPSAIAEQLSFAQLVAALDAEVSKPGAWVAARPARASDIVVVAAMLDHLLRPVGVDPGPASVYHASSNGLAALVCLVANRRHGVPFVLTEHGIYLRERYLELRRLPMARPARALLLRFHRLVTATAYARAAVVAPGSRWNVRWESRHGTPDEVVQTIYNGIDPTEFPQRETEPDSPVVAWLGRVDPIKDLETLVASFAVVREARPDARLRLYGRTPPGNEDYRARLDALVEELDLGAMVSFEGGVARSADAYADAQIGVLSSISEGFPYSLIEAMVCGLPAVATGVGGVEEAVADTGLVVVPRSPELLGAAIVELLDDGPRRRDMGIRARERVLEHFTVETCLDGFRRIYADLPGTFRVPRLRAVPAAPDSTAPAGACRPGPLSGEQRDELVAAVGGAEGLAQALDVDEVAATLESVGVTDRIAELRFDSPDVFDLAERLWGASAHAEPPRQVPPPRPQPEGALGRGLAYVLPALVVAAAVLAGADQATLVAASVGAWGIGQAAGVLAFAAMHRSSGPRHDLSPLRGGLAVAAAAAVLVGLGVAVLRGAASGLSAALPLIHLVGATGLIVAGRTRVVLWALAPVSALSVVVVVRPRPSATSLVAPVTVLSVVVMLVIVAVSARGGTRSHGLLQKADWVASIPLALCGWVTAAFALLSVSATSHLPELAARTDSRQWLLLAMPLWVVVAASEWFILAMRRALGSRLEASPSVAAFTAAATRLVGRATLLGVAILALAVLAGAAGAASASGVPFPAACTAAGVFGVVAAALYGATVLAAASHIGPVLAVMTVAASLLGWLAVTAHNPFALGDHQVALVVAGAVAVVLCAGAGRTLVDPASHR